MQLEEFVYDFLKESTAPLTDAIEVVGALRRFFEERDDEDAVQTLMESFS